VKSFIGSTTGRLEKNSRDGWEHFDDGINLKFIVIIVEDDVDGPPIEEGK